MEEGADVVNLVGFKVSETLLCHLCFDIGFLQMMVIRSLQSFKNFWKLVDEICNQSFVWILCLQFLRSLIQPVLYFLDAINLIRRYSCSSLYCAWKWLVYSGATERRNALYFNFLAFPTRVKARSLGDKFESFVIRFRLSKELMGFQTLLTDVNCFLHQVFSF